MVIEVRSFDELDLRMSCPCAGCVDEVSGRRTLTEAMVPPGVYVYQLVVGSDDSSSERFGTLSLVY